MDVWGIDSDQDQECMLQLTRFNQMPLLTVAVNNKINSELDFSTFPACSKSGLGHESLPHLKLFYCGHFTYWSCVFQILHA